MLGRVFGLWRDDITGGLIKLHNEKTHNFYSSLSTVVMTKSRRMGLARHVTQRG
jgi:hypothetical protein